MQNNNDKKEAKPGSEYPGFDLLKLIIEDTAIDNTCHAKCGEHIIQNISDARNEAFEHLQNTIEDLDNKHFYKQIIEELVEYALIIIDTHWDDYNSYTKHIGFLNELLDRFSSSLPNLINCKYLPFGNQISFDLQHRILNYKYKQENKYWLRYQYLMNHINPILNYLEMKKEWASYYCGNSNFI